jgi:phosphocarrier protein HPr
MVARTVVISNVMGLHARAAARFVHLAGTFQAQVTVTRGARTVDGKSILGILLLAASRGTAIDVTAEGPDERDALDALCGMIAAGFGEPA